MHTINDISELKTNLVEELKHEIRCKGYYGVDTGETGQIVDMIKDLSQAEKDCMEACYYTSVIGAMDEYGFEDERDIENYGRAGYNTRRYSSGRYAPKGSGHYSPIHGYSYPDYSYSSTDGYTPMHSRMPMSYDNDRMGYPGEAEMRNEYGQAYRDYKQSMRHYHETGDANEKMRKDRYAEKHVEDTVETVKDIWSEASPELKKKIKGDMSKLLAEMTI